MEITNIKSLIESKLACIDIENKTNKERDLNSPHSLLRYELSGIRQALRVMGINLELSINPYFFEDEQPSSYKISLN